MPRQHTRFVHGPPTDVVPVVNDRDVLRLSTRSVDWDNPPSEASFAHPMEQFLTNPGWVNILNQADEEQLWIDKIAWRTAMRKAGYTMAQIVAYEQSIALVADDSPTTYLVTDDTGVLLVAD